MNETSRSSAGRTPPRARAGDLLSQVARDLEPCAVARRDDGSAIVTAPDGTSFELTIAIDRRKLMTLQETSAHVWGPPVTGSGMTKILVHHTGQLRRTGLRAKLRGPADTQAAQLCEQLLGDERLGEACLPLDFTRFELVPIEGRWRVDLRLMGASHVRTRLPPGGSYVRLSSDQVCALLDTVTALRALFSESGAARDTSTSVVDAPLCEGGLVPRSDRSPKPRHVPTRPSRVTRET